MFSLPRALIVIILFFPVAGCGGDDATEAESVCKEALIEKYPNSDSAEFAFIQVEEDSGTWVVGGEVQFGNVKLPNRFECELFKGDSDWLPKRTYIESNF